MPRPPASAARLRGNILSVLLCGTALALAPNMSFGQDGDDTLLLEPIIIQGQLGDSDTIVAQDVQLGGKVATSVLDTSASISIVTAKELQDRGVTTVEQALQYTPGITTDFYGSDDRFDYFKIRGFDAFAYRDGLTLGRPFGSVREETYAFERVEILRGANSTLFGVSDPGGAVNYVTKLPRQERFGEVYATVGSHDRAEIGVDLGDNLTSDGTLAYRFTAKVTDAKNEIDFSKDDSKFLMGGLTWRPSDVTSVSVVLDYSKREGTSDAGQPLGTDYDRSRFFGEPDFNFRGHERTTLSLLADHDFGGGLSFSGNARYTKQSSEFGYVYLRDSNPNDTLATREYFYGYDDDKIFVADAHLAYNAQFGEVKSRTLAGVQYEDRSSDSTGGFGYLPGTIDGNNLVYVGRDVFDPFNATVGTDESGSHAIYVQQDLTFDRFILNLGFRRDWFDAESIGQTTNFNGAAPDTTSQTAQRRDFGENTGRIGLTYKVTPEVSVYGSYAESAVIATNTPRNAGAFEPQPERGEQYELGVKYSPEGTRALFTAAMYDLRKTNIVQVDSVDPTIVRQVAEVRARGFELEARAELTNAIELVAAYSYTDTENLDEESANFGNSFDKVPLHLASAWAGYTLDGNGQRGDMTFGLGARYTGTYYTDAANNRKIESAMLFDASYSYDLREDTALSVNVTNLFDEKHDTGGLGIYYNPGRTIAATIRRTW